MTAEHAVCIFVFRMRGGLVEYLFVRRQPTHEFDWNPIITPLRPEDTLRRAATRRMTRRWEAPVPRPWIDLHHFDHSEVGDLDLVHWSVGYGVEENWRPTRDIAKNLAGLCWQPLPRAFRLLETNRTRRALFRIHLEVSGRGL